MSDIVEKAAALVEELYTENPLPTIGIKPSEAAEPLPVTVSKFGGVPYLPIGVEAPTDSDGVPMGMIAQINCTELPENPIYPPTGMVQFWVSTNAGWGIDKWGIYKGENHRVIYYPQLGEANPDAVATWEDHEREFWWPIKSECALAFTTPGREIFAPNDSINHPLLERWNQAYPEQAIMSLFDLEDFEVEEIEEFTGSGDYSRLGGLPDFVQGDPRREYPESSDIRRRTVNLLTINSNIGVLWGDCGTANWVIAPDRLAARDFSQVFYEWSCG
ncbi:YwqG family protein [Rothia sp. HMSC036D11]|uniref:YwqG family protein n=1 Tax=Rothia sp. HMSC036D11 TaxID=1739462 RepID=UPI001FEF78CF|nr:YwqG family protein [Rothia sp. HMSC036D11]